jgi:hypothetical protein
MLLVSDKGREKAQVADMSSLREEFEKVLLSPDGLHSDAEACAKAWDAETSSDERLSEMIELAAEWLRLCTRSRSVNTRTPSSFGLKNICSRWHGRDGHGPRILNGVFLMACHRLGFLMQAQPPRYVEKIGRCDANAWINIATWPSDANRRPGTERKEVRV